jgi:hypothetical protein
VLEHGRPDAVLEAVAGVPLDAGDLRDALTGCTPVAAAADGKQFGAAWRVVTAGDTTAYLRRNGQAKWEIVAATHGARGEWRAEYRDFQAGLPRTVHLVSATKDRFNLQLALSQVELNAAMAADVFQVRVPPDADPITLDELRRSGPFGAPARESSAPSNRK